MYAGKVLGDLTQEETEAQRKWVNGWPALPLAPARGPDASHLHCASPDPVPPCGPPHSQ